MYARTYGRTHRRANTHTHTRTHAETDAHTINKVGHARPNEASPTRDWALLPAVKIPCFSSQHFYTTTAAPTGLV